MSPSDLDGVQRGRLTRHSDARGSFRELWRGSWYPGADFTQANASVSAQGVLRGLHLHRRQSDLWVVGSGRAFVALVDVRPLLEGADRPLVETFEMIADDWCFIPPGVAHGFLAIEALELLYFVTNEYDGTDEHGFAWDDGLAAVAWPDVQTTADRRPILSDRDRRNPPLRELVGRLSAMGSA
jgi:dTDP-4-dehydrorhamnose 3,5-epimerase